jgi:MFS family permease
MTAAPEVSSQRWNVPAAVAISLVIQTVISLLGASIPVLAPQIAADRGLNPEIIAFYSPIICIAAIIMNFLVPYLLDRIGGMGLSLLCVVLSVLGLLCLLLPGTVLLFAAPFALGLAGGAMNPASSQVLGPRATARTAGLIMSLKQTGVPVGGVLAGILLPFLVLRWGWEHAVVVLVVASAGLVIVHLPTVRWLNGPRSSVRPAPYRPFEPVKRLLAIPGMPAILGAALLFTGMQHCLRSFFTVYLVSWLGLPLTVAGVAFAASQVAGIVGQIGWAVLSDRLGSRMVMSIIGVVMTLAAVLTAIITPGWPLAAIVTVGILFGLSAAGFIPVVLAEVARRSPAGEVGALTSGANLFIISGVLVGPLTFGLIGALSSYAAAFAAMGACTLVASIILAGPKALAPGRFFRLVGGEAATVGSSAGNQPGDAPPR